MNTDTKYNGWTNYETWLVALWIDNDEGSQDYWRERGASCRWRNESAARADLAYELKDYHQEAVQGLNMVGMFLDMLNGALSSVNWREIADRLLEE